MTDTKPEITSAVGVVGTNPLLATKLLIPRARPDLVQRPQLISRLNDILDHKVTVIEAPAGFGKTTILSLWSSSPLGKNSPVVWVSLDEDDNDPTRFWSYLIRAFGKLKKGLEANLLPLLVPPNPQPIENIITSLINELAALEKDFIIVLDDFHVIDTDTIHQAVSFLIENQPPQMHLVIAGRSIPALPLARLRGGGQLIELDATDLRFSSEETAFFINQLMGIDLSPEDISALESHTEGWIAGLQMAALSMRGHEDVSGYIASFAGDDRSIMDYLIEEVLSKQPAHVQDFLMDTSILERLTSSLCDHITGREDSQKILEQLEVANLFIGRLDNRRLWYRYHRLFADLLRHRLENTYPEKISELHNLASQWYENNNLPDEALDHALRSGDQNRLVFLLEKAGEPILKHGLVNVLLECLEALPQEMVRARPRLSLFYAWALLRNARFEDVEVHLKEAEEGLAAGEDDAVEVAEPQVRNLLGAVAALRGSLALNVGDTPRTLELSRQALEYLSEDNLLIRGVVARNLGDVYESRDDLAGAVQSHQDAISMSQKSGDLFEEILATSRLGRLFEIQGGLSKAVETYQGAIQRVKDSGGPAPPVLALVHMGLGDLLRERNELEQAQFHLDESIKELKQWGQGALLAEAYSYVARLKYAQGEAVEALQTIEKAKNIARAGNQLQTTRHLAGIQARLWIRTGNLEPAIKWMNESGLSPDDDLAAIPFRLLRLEYISLARLLTVLKRSDEALGLLDRLIIAAENSGRLGGLIEVLECKALALHIRGDLKPATTVLHEALVLAEPEGFIRIFVSEGPEMAELLTLVIKEKGPKAPYTSYETLANYIRKLIIAMENWERDVSPEVNGNVQPLLDPLSDRELEVLRELAGGMSNREIGEKLFVALNTVKTHIRNIYSKLDVRSRTQALLRARELGLI